MRHLLFNVTCLTPYIITGALVGFDIMSGANMTCVLLTFSATFLVWNLKKVYDYDQISEYIPSYTAVYSTLVLLTTSFAGCIGHWGIYHGIVVAGLCNLNDPILNAVISVGINTAIIAIPVVILTLIFIRKKDPVLFASLFAEFMISTMMGLFTSATLATLMDNNPINVAVQMLSCIAITTICFGLLDNINNIIINDDKQKEMPLI